ncbi:MAG TPA: hypothetical protein VFO01_03845 [Trebonia sp.]|nr:hypothetical protein [Trebonia sp.]
MPAPLTQAERARYTQVTRDHAAGALRFVNPGDLAVLHDPQTLGMARPLVEAGVRVIWQCHLGSLEANPWTDQVWEFFGDDLFAPHGYVFSHPRYVPGQLGQERVRIIMPAIDPASPKNRPLTDTQVATVLHGTGLAPAGDELGDSLGAEMGRLAGSARWAPSTSVRSCRPTCRWCCRSPGRARSRTGRWSRRRSAPSASRSSTSTPDCSSTTRAT